MLTTTDAGDLLLLHVCLALLGDHAQLGSGWMGAGGQGEKKNFHEDSEGAVCEEERPETASRLAGKPSTAEARRPVQPAERGAQPAPLSLLQGRRPRLQRPLQPQPPQQQRSRQDKSHPQPRPCNPSGSKGDASWTGDGEGESKPLGGPGQVFGGRGRSRPGGMRRAGRCCPFKRRRRSPDLLFPRKERERRRARKVGRCGAGRGEAGRAEGSTPPSRPPCGLPAGQPRSVTQPGSKSTVRPRGRGRDQLWGPVSGAGARRAEAGLAGEETRGPGSAPESADVSGCAADRRCGAEERGGGPSSAAVRRAGERVPHPQPRVLLSSRPGARSRPHPWDPDPAPPARSCARRSARSP